MPPTGMAQVRWKSKCQMKGKELKNALQAHVGAPELKRLRGEYAEMKDQEPPPCDGDEDDGEKSLSRFKPL